MKLLLKMAKQQAWWPPRLELVHHRLIRRQMCCFVGGGGQEKHLDLLRPNHKYTPMKKELAHYHLARQWQ